MTILFFISQEQRLLDRRKPNEWDIVSDLACGHLYFLLDSYEAKPELTFSPTGWKQMSEWHIFNKSEKLFQISPL